MIEDEVNLLLRKMRDYYLCDCEIEKVIKRRNIQVEYWMSDGMFDDLLRSFIVYISQPPSLEFLDSEH